MNTLTPRKMHFTCARIFCVSNLIKIKGLVLPFIRERERERERGGGAKRRVCAGEPILEVSCVERR
jgi:hypothetical protein